jgi:hypothetical protein
MGKILKWSLLVGGLLSLVLAVRYAISYINIATSYAAKMTCSCHFISKRAVESIKVEELYAVPFVDVNIDDQKKIVVANAYGLAKKTAYYRPGLGCTLLNGVSTADLDNQPKPKNFHKPGEGIDLQKGTIPSDIDSLKLINAINWAFDEDTNLTQNTRAILVVHKGKIIAERYKNGIDVDMPHLGWSMTKSVTNAMIGIYLKQRGLDQKITTGFVEWNDDSRKNITLSHLLHMSSGLSFEERYDQPSDATKMLFVTKNTASVALQKHQKFQPERVFNYSSGTSNILQEYLKRNLNTQEYIDFPHQFLFSKLGMKTAVIEPDASGTYVGSSFMYCSARDWAKFGMLYLQNGIVNGDTILSPSWIKYTSTPAPAADGYYGAHFWMDQKNDQLPKDFYQANGFEGQRINIIPSKDLLIVRLGVSKNDDFDDLRLTKGILDSFK